MCGQCGSTLVENIVGNSSRFSCVDCDIINDMLATVDTVTESHDSHHNIKESIIDFAAIDSTVNTLQNVVPATVYSKSPIACHTRKALQNALSGKTGVKK